MATKDGRSRVVIESVRPEVDCGRYPAKRVVGEEVEVHADVFVDGHDVVTAMLQYRSESESNTETGWHDVPMEPLVNDEWIASFEVEHVGSYRYRVLAWTDRFLSWHRDFGKRVAAGQVTPIDLLTGAELVEATAKVASGDDQQLLNEWNQRLRSESALAHAQQIFDDAELPALMKRHANRDLATYSERELLVSVDPVRARNSAWYEMFPRSCSDTPGQHGTLKDVQARLPYVAEMGFDVLYLPPIHPIGDMFRKGKNNTTEAQPGDVGSPWGIGNSDGGHKAIHRDLGTFDDFDQMVAAAKDLNIEIAMDIAFQCSPDHPYVTEHPDWFIHRPDGTIQYAENPPKKYQDIYPINFESADWKALWNELKSVFEFWIGKGISIFRVDNPHTKPFPFWEWCIGEIKKQHPEVLFLAEAFTRPKIMHRLAKLGFSQSYTYFAWRNTKQELTKYVTELTKSDVREFFRPNFWPNTPDILPEFLQMGGRAAFMSRLVLAATLSTNYGIYGPTYEHCWSMPVKPGSEEYMNSEKYQVHHHDLTRSDSLNHFIALVNKARNESSVLKEMWNIEFHDIDNEEMICYSKTSPDKSEIILAVVNLDPHHTQSGWVDLPMEYLELDSQQPYQLHDLLSDARYLWSGSRNFVELDPHKVPAHLFEVKRRVRTEQDFEYYL